MTSSAGRALLRAVVAHPGDVPGLGEHVERHGLGELTESAVGHGVAGLLHTAVVAAGLTGADGARGPAEESQRAWLQHARSLADLAAVGRALAGARVPVTVVKGPALVRRWYRPGERGFADLDVVVPPGLFDVAVEHLEAAGFSLVDANWPLLRREEVAQLRLRAPSGGLVDLHWHLLNDRRARAVHDLGRDTWQAGLEEVVLGGAAVTVLRPAVALVHLCVHAASSGAHRLIWLADVDRVARDVTDWTAVVGMARRARVLPPVGLVLARTSRVLGTPVPPGVWRAVLPGPARVASALVDRSSPVPGTTSAGSLAQLVTRSAADRWGPTSRELARRGATWARQGSRSSARSSAALFDVDDPASAVHAAGGALGRAAYLSWVVGGR